MVISGEWAIGVDLGGTKIEAALVDRAGSVRKQWRHPTAVGGGVGAVKEQIVRGVAELQTEAAGPVVGVGVGVAGQIGRDTGEVRFAPNLDWHDVPLQSDLKQALNLPVIVANDVRAAAWGEWLYGAGRGCGDLICIFVGTGIGGGVVTGGQMLSGCSNTGGEIGHIVVDMHGPVCTCGNRGCLEALAGGWAIARRAKEVVKSSPRLGDALLRKAVGRSEDITAKMIVEAYRTGDRLSRQVLDEAAEAIVAGAASLINSINPCRIILGGGIIEGLPEWVERVDKGVRLRALTAATELLQVLKAQLGGQAGVIGAAALAFRMFSDEL